jgi:CRP-like cAMP-binding protein
MASATAVGQCSIARLEKQVVVERLHEEPAFSALFISYLLSRNVRMEADLIDQLFNSSEKRLARLRFFHGVIIRPRSRRRPGHPSLAFSSKSAP